MTGPVYNQNVIDDLNMQLFELSETGNSDAYSFFEQVASVLRAAGMPLKDGSLVNFDAESFDTTEQPEGPPQIAQTSDGEAIYLYLAYSKARQNNAFASHAELVTATDLEEINRFYDIDEDMDSE